MKLEAQLARARERLRAGRIGEARAILLRAAASSPNHPDITGLLCFVLAQTGEHERSAYYGERAVAARPDVFDLRLNLASTYMDLDRPDDAALQFRAACALRPDDDLPHEHLVAALNHAGRFRDAEVALAESLARFPHSARLACRRADTLAALGRATEAVTTLRNAIERHPDDPAILTDLCSTLPYDPQAAPQTALLAFQAYGALVQRQTPRRARLPLIDTDPDRPLRVGFVSPDLRSHAVATFLEPLLEHLDPDQVEAIAYFTGPREDHVSARLRSLVARWRAGSVSAIAGRIVEDAPDVLFDLSGHSTGHALPLFQMRFAPIQITYLGWPSTTGVPEMDYRLTDAVADPQGSEAAHTERLLRLDPCALCYKPHPDAPPPRMPAGAPHPPTFGSFNAISKINDAVIALWARLLRETPDARLALKHTALAHEQGRAIIERRFADAGIEPARLALLPPTAHAEHLAAYHAVDVALDPFPFNGATTTCDALHMGVPVITLPGATSSSRVASSILRAAGFHRWIAGSEDEYIDKARALLLDSSALRAGRADLRDRFLASPICDGAAFARRFEAALRAAWRERRDRPAPDA